MRPEPSGAEVREKLRAILEFYRALGFDRLPVVLTLPGEGPAPCGRSEDLSLQGHVHDVSPEKDALPHKEDLMRQLREEIGDCQRCRLAKGRTNIVFGEGDPDARIMFIGEGPGREEDLKARPFVGEAGQILTSLINKMGQERGFTRNDVYIANVVKCRPPMNRDPQEDEIAMCVPFLHRQIEIISPEVIMSLGRVSTHTLLGMKGPLSKLSITKVRGKWYEYVEGESKIPLMPTFHPAYFLRNPKDKRLTWEDALAVLARLQQREADE